MSEFDVVIEAFLRANLRLDVETSQEYTGGMDGAPLYSESKTVRLLLCDEVISEVYL